MINNLLHANCSVTHSFRRRDDATTDTELRAMAADAIQGCKYAKPRLRTIYVNRN
jgi:hypothetical protein